MTSTSTIKKLSAFVLTFAAFAACSREPMAEDAQAGSGLTAINVTLPPKSSLPSSIAGQADLSYCFAVISGMGGIVSDGELYAPRPPANCIAAYSSSLPEQSGLYKENLSLNVKLQRNQHHTLVLKIYGKQHMSVAATPTADGLYEVTYYAAATPVTPRDMAGKTKLQVVMKLQKAPGLDNTFPDDIPTPEGEVDVDVKVEMPDENEPSPVVPVTPV